MEQILSVLSTEWQHRFDEKLFHMQRYHRQGDILQGFIALLLGGIAFALGNNDARQLLASPQTASSDVHLIVGGFVVTLILIEQHQLFSLLDSFVLIFRNAHRIAALEIKINEILGQDAALWDSRVSPAFYEPKSKWEFPRRFDQLGPFTLLVSLIGLHVVFAWFLLRFWPHKTLVVVMTFATLTVINLIQFIWIGFFAINRIRDLTFQKSLGSAQPKRRRHGS